MTVYAITDIKKGEQGLRLLIFKFGPERLLVTPACLCCSKERETVTSLVAVMSTLRGNQE